MDQSLHTRVCIARTSFPSDQTTSERISAMQNSSKSQDITRAGGPDDTRGMPTSDEEQEEQPEVTTEQKKPVYR